MFFEGSEKKLEVIIDSSSLKLRSLPREFWGKMVNVCDAEILSSISNTDCDAYLLSESSLFVWDHCFVMITCGNTVLVNSLEYFLKEFNTDHLQSVIFQRKNEYCSDLQKTSFSCDVKKIRELIPTVCMRFGYLDEHHTYMLHLDRMFSPDQDDVTTELLMYHIQGDASEILRQKDQDIQRIRDLIGLKELFKDFIVDDHVFSPYGYSLNAIKEDKYVTIHITPQEESSYVSFETNLNLNKDYPWVVDKVLNTFGPFSFDVVDFNTQTEVKENGVRKINQFRENLKSGYTVNFSHFIKPKKEIELPTKLEGSDR